MGGWASSVYVNEIEYAPWCDRKTLNLLESLTALGE